MAVLDKADIEGSGEEICDKVHMGIWYLLDFGNFIHMYENIDNIVMYVLTVIWGMYSFVLLGIRWCTFSSIMEKYCPYIMRELRGASLQKNNMEVERILDELMESTENPEVKKAVQVRKAVYPIWIFQIYVLAVSLIIMGPVYTVFSSL